GGVRVQRPFQRARPPLATSLPRHRPFDLNGVRRTCRISGRGLPSGCAPDSMRRMSSRLLVVALCLGFAAACGPRRAPAEARTRAFPLAGPLREGASVAPRGGTTQGTEVQLQTEPSPEWRALQAPGLTARERDRRAILAMTGTFRTTFDFLEVAGFRPGFT